MSLENPIPSVDTVTVDIREEQRVNGNLRRFLSNPFGVASAAVLVVIALAAIILPFVLPGDPNRADAASVLAAPSPEHLLGTDSAGRDVLLRLVYASRISLAGMVLALAISAVLGVTAGIIAGYFRRWFESLSSAVVSVLMAIPGILFLLAARSVLGPSFWMLMALAGVLLSPALYRIVYGSVLSVREEPYIDSARVSGVPDRTIVMRHVLTAVRAPVIIQLAMLAGVAISIQAGLDFLGVGDITIPTWGQLLNDGFTNLYVAPLLMLWPSLAIAICCVAFSLLGNALRDALERTEKSLPSRAKEPREPRAQGATPAADVPGALVQITDLAIEYPTPQGATRTVVDGVDLTVRTGEVHGIVGESGSGKSQTAFALLDLLPETARVSRGDIRFDGAHIDRATIRRLRGRAIGYVPQDPISNLDPSYTVGHQLVEPLRHVGGRSRRQARVEALELLRRVGITDAERVFRAYPHEISGGMAQRVLIAGALSSEPRLIVADEPTTALDVTVQSEILDVLRRLQQDTGLTVILITHNFGVVADICDSVSVMQNGRVVESGPVDAIFSAPQHSYTKSLLAAVLDDPPARGALAPTPDDKTKAMTR